MYAVLTGGRLMYKDTKWARDILALQQPDGSWGCFHTLSRPTPRQPMTTEQALRRLRALGYTRDDPPIQRTLCLLHDCLTGRRPLPDRREKSCDWDAFVALMLAAWIRLFTDADAAANRVAAAWAGIVTPALAGGAFDPAAYAVAHRLAFGRPAKGSLLLYGNSFYHVALLAGALPPETERRWIDYLLRFPTGIYYMYTKPMQLLPDAFRSRPASAYLAAAELLARYPHSRDSLRFIADWLLQNGSRRDGWDMGPQARDGVYFPLSDSWRSPSVRKRDCTYRISRLLDTLIV